MKSPRLILCAIATLSLAACSPSAPSSPQGVGGNVAPPSGTGGSAAGGGANPQSWDNTAGGGGNGGAGGTATAGNTAQGSTTDAAVPSADGSAAGTTEEARSQLVRSTTDPTDSEKHTLSSELSDFAFAFLKQFEPTEQFAKQNIAYSPTSITLALSMAYAGAKGNTATQMQSAMHITTSSDVYFRSLNWLDRELSTRPDAARASALSKAAHAGPDAGPNPDDFRLHVVNALWGEKTLTFEPSYLDTLATQFGAGVRLADFIGRPDPERIAINTWVSQETLQRINDLIPQGAIDSSTRAVLVNAIHLKLPWADPMRLSTSPAAFTKADGTTVNVPFLQGGGHYAYAEDASLQAVAIPLEGQDVDFVVFLPKSTSSLTQLEGALSSASVQSLMQSMTSQTVSLSMPKFKFTTPSLSVTSLLLALGMTDAFGPVADFSGITRETALFISDVVHKAMVGVDEHGVEAAAATAVMMAGSAMPTDVKQVNVTRPFFFGIRDVPTSTWLFLGHVLDPSQASG